MQEACQKHGLRDHVVAVEMTGVYHRPVQRAFRQAGSETRLVHPFASRHYRLYSYPRAFLPDLIDRVGIEILDPIQWRCSGMAREKLVADFGRLIIFHGSIDNQQTLPFGTPDDVAREVRESVEIYRGSRWICGPCHNLQPVSPTANIVALYEAIREVGA